MERKSAAYLPRYFPRKFFTLIVHSKKRAAYFKRVSKILLYKLYRFKRLRYSLQTIVFALHGNYHFVRGEQAVDGQKIQARPQVDKYIFVRVAHGIHKLSQ